jgi:hypothetical protein
MKIQQLQAKLAVMTVQTEELIEYTKKLIARTNDRVSRTVELLNQTEQFPTR